MGRKRKQDIEPAQPTSIWGEMQVQSKKVQGTFNNPLFILCGHSFPVSMLSIWALNISNRYGLGETCARSYGTWLKTYAYFSLYFVYGLFFLGQYTTNIKPVMESWGRRKHALLRQGISTLATVSNIIYVPSSLFLMVWWILGSWWFLFGSSAGETESSCVDLFREGSRVVQVGWLHLACAAVVFTVATQRAEEASQASQKAKTG